MIAFQGINGLCFGLEYTETEEFGFILCLDLGLFRIVWYKDLELDEDEEEE
jgi:hypothetical protein